jgi:hypothetical protein
MEKLKSLRVESNVIPFPSRASAPPSGDDLDGCRGMAVAMLASIVMFFAAFVLWQVC